MRILWFSITSSLYDGNSTMGSWVESLERIVRKHTDCQLAIAWQTDRPLPRKTDGNVTYFPMHMPRNRFQHRYIDDYTYKYTDKFLVEEGKRLIEEFKPDIIHVFGTEWAFGLLTEHTKVPIVVHMQGIWSASRNIIMEQKATKGLWDFMHDDHRPQMWLSFLRKRHKMKERAEREARIIAMNRYFMGRTRWDKAITSMLAPNAKYFHCNEALRESFVSSMQDWQVQDGGKCTLLTVGNSDMAKGYPLILQTARILKQYAPFPFEWNLIGIGDEDFNYLYRRYRIDHKEVNINACGTRNAEEIVEKMQKSSIFVQASITDNSPNAVCEAQYMGMPIIATNVGGVPSLFDKAYDTDMLVPLHDPYYLAAKIIEIFQDKERMQRLGNLNKEIARKRHNDEDIDRCLFECYAQIIEVNKQ